MDPLQTGFHHGMYGQGQAPVSVQHPSTLVNPLANTGFNANVPLSSDLYTNEIQRAAAMAAAAANMVRKRERIGVCVYAC
jgi:hypothetical protein